MTGFKIRFDKYFDAYFKEKLQQHLYRIDPSIREILMHVYKLALDGGKRARPLIAYLSFRTAIGNKKYKEKEIFQVLLALELFHLFALVHDDIIDKGEKRHGITTLHRYVSKNVDTSSRYDRYDQTHYGNSQAILAGDLLFNWSWEQLMRAVPSKHKEKITELFSTMVNEVIVGQMFDVAMLTTQETSKKTVMRKTELKTAHYTFVHPMQIGFALVGNYKKSQATFAMKCGVALGIAFQMQDDLLDITGNATTLGKATLNDLKEGQHTFFTQYVADNGSPKERRMLESWWGRTLSVAESKEAQEFFKYSGAIAYGEKHIKRYYKEAKKEIDAFPMKKELREEWTALVAFLESRTN